MTIRENVSLAPFTTFDVGGAARYFAEPTSQEEVVAAVRFARDRGLRVFVLGGGSNILVSDDGVNGLVLRLCITGIVAAPKDNATIVTAGAGVCWDEFVQWTLAHQLRGAERLSGIPGTVGGAVVANIGAYGANASDTFESAEVMDLNDPALPIMIVTKDQCGFSYHHSMFATDPYRYALVRANFRFTSEFEVHEAYQDNRFTLKDVSPDSGTTLSPADIRSAVLAMREAKGTLIMAGRVSYKCAGSFFHMPFVSPEKYDSVVERARALDEQKELALRPWAWQQEDGSYKIAPGFLLEYTKFQKGFRRGHVGISPRHILSIINCGGARAQEIAELARDMRSAVFELFHIMLEREVAYVGNISDNGEDVRKA